MSVLRRISLFIIAATVAAGNFTATGEALSGVEREMLRGNYPMWFAAQNVCGSGSIAANTGPTLNGHTLPASKGGTGIEDPLTPEGRVIFNDGSLGGNVAFAGSIPKNDARLSQLFRDYYITMRWSYVAWNWDGTSGGAGTESKDFYGTAPRVLVTNPATNKSIIAVVLEAGPAPWTGVISPPNLSGSALQSWVNERKPSYWQTPQTGTPLEYTGRVSGFPPKAIAALGATMRFGSQGGDLIYAWAPDQSAEPGPTNLTAAPSSGGTTPTSPATPLPAECVAAASASATLGGDLRRDTSMVPCPVGEKVNGPGPNQSHEGYAQGKAVNITVCRVQGIRVNVLIAQVVDEMIKAARAQGITLGGGGFRTMQEQKDTRVANRCSEGPNCVNPPNSGYCATLTACPGYSNHQMGLAIDFTASGQLITKSNATQTAAFNWLKANGKLKNLPAEPWHWSVDGH